MKDTVRRGIYFNQTPCSESNNKLKNIAIVGRRLRLIFDVIIILVIVIIITIIITIVTVIRSIFLLNTNRIQAVGRQTGNTFTISTSSFFLGVTISTTLLLLLPLLPLLSLRSRHYYDYYCCR